MTDTGTASRNGAAGGCPETDTPTVTVEALRDAILLLAWLHAELAHRQMMAATMVATLMAEKMQPQIQRTLLAQLTGVG